MQELIEAIEARAKEFGPRLAALAYSQGLAVTSPDGSTRPIPIAANPIAVEAARIRSATDLSRRLSLAAFKMGRYALSGELRELVLGAMGPKERAIVEKTHPGARRLACTRVDFFAEGEAARGPLRALEINATIPAMQGYSDIAAGCFLETIGALAGATPAQISSWRERNGSNVLALYQGLIGAFQAERGTLPTRIAVLCRRNDSQLSELRYIASRFGELGTPAQVVYPDQLGGRERLEADGKAFDLVYRHFFVRRLNEIDAPFLAQFFSEYPSPRAAMFNPPSSQFEIKTTFALLSEAIVNPSLAAGAQLDEAELDAIRAAVPWTRVFRAGPTTDAAGRPIADIVAHVISQPSRFVLKRAWEYGGKAVFVGQAAAEPGFAERSRAAYGEALDWDALCRRAAEDRVGGGFVVQEFIPITSHHVLVCSPNGLQPADWYIDFSAYASVEVEPSPAWGGVCRGSASEVVNIVGGGGVLPLIERSIADEISGLLQRAP